jgi:hypothetical protein
MGNEKTKKTAKKYFDESIACCISNGERLLDELRSVDFLLHPATRLYLSIIAQEEFAKAFILYLVKKKIIRWDRFILRAINDHCCKQLVGVVLDFLSPDDIQFQKRLNYDFDSKFPFAIPKKVTDAIKILKFEKINHWESNVRQSVETPKYDRISKSIAKGCIDKIKQDALFVRLGKNGVVTSCPEMLTSKSAEIEFERANRFEYFAGKLLGEQNPAAFDYEEIEKVFGILFSQS